MLVNLNDPWRLQASVTVIVNLIEIGLVIESYRSLKCSMWALDSASVDVNVVFFERLEMEDVGVNLGIGQRDASTALGPLELGRKV